MATLSPPPLENVLGGKEGNASPPWTRWFRQLWDTARGQADLAPSLGTVANTEGVQTLTNKSISGATNTLTAIPFSALSPVYWSANGSTTSCNNNNLTTIVWTNEVLDSAGVFNGTTWTCPTGQAGIYVAAAMLTFQTAAYTEKTCLILKNGGQAFNHINQDTEAVYHSQLAVGMLSLAAGDTVSVGGYQTNGAAAARTFLNNNFLTYFFGWRIA